MSTDSRIDSDLKALADSTARGLPTIDETARALAEAQAKRGGFMRTIRKPIWATTLAFAAVAVVLVFPVPYSRTVGYELTLRGPGARVAKLRLGTRDAAQAERRAAALRKNGTEVTVAPRTERVWGPVFAMANEKLLHIHVDFGGKTDEEVANDIRDQLSQAGWSAGDVQVQRSSDGSSVEISADDGQGRHVQVVRKAQGGSEAKMDLEVGGIDDAREPGMTDAQLKDKILKQLQARGLDADVQVDGDRIEIRASRKSTVEE
jgi:hypothetical protein